MGSDVQEILVLRGGTHGLSSRPFGKKLRERLPNQTVRVAKTPAQERRYIEQADIVVGVDIDTELLNHASNLRLFACMWAGTGHLPLDDLASADVTVTNAAGIHAPNIAETVIGHILVFARRLDEGWRRKDRCEWRHFRAYEFAGSTVTIVGQGTIGQAVTERLEGFGVTTIGVRYTPSKGGPAERVIGFDIDDFHEALAETDYLVLASPLTKTTKHLIDGAEFETLQPSAVIINVGRGRIIATSALVQALRDQSIRGAALDVTDPEPLPSNHPLWEFENVFITPHNAGHSPEHWSRLADIVSKNVGLLNKGKQVAELDNIIHISK